MAIGNLNYIISADTRSFVRSMVASRTEATLQKRILEQMRTPLDDWTVAQQRLNNMVSAGTLDTDSYLFAMNRLFEQHPDAIANTNALAEAQRQEEESARRVAHSVDQLTRRLAEQVATYGQSNEAIDLYRLKEQGASDDQLQQVASLQEELAALRQTTAAEQEAAAVKDRAAAAEAAKADAVLRSANQMQTALQEEIATRGMSADQVALWKLEQQGATQATIAGVAAIQREAGALRQQDAATAAAAAEANRLETEVEQVAQALRTEAATAGMTADQIQLYKLRTQGATAATIQQIAALQRQRTAAQQAVGGQRDLASGLQQVAQGAGGTIPGVSGLTNTLQLGHPVLIAAAVAVAGLAIAYKAAKAAVDWYVGGVKDALDSIDQLSKEARTLGTSVQDLREIRFAMGEIAGINTSSADRQMERLSKAIADANAGATEQSDAFRQLKLDARALADTGAAESIQLIAGAMDQIPSRTERIRIAQQLFGKDSADLVNFLIAGQQAIDASTDAARRYGGVISELDAAQVEATNDAWGRVSVALAGLTEQAAVELAPALQVAAEKVLELLDPGTSSGQALRMALDVIPPLLSRIIDLSDILIGKFQQKQVQVLKLGNVFVQTAAIADQALAAMVPGREANADLQAWAADYSRQIEVAAAEAEARIASGFNGGTGQAIAARAAQAKRDAAAAEAAKSAGGGNAGMLDALAVAAQQQLAGATAETTGAIRTQAAAISELDDALTNATTSTAGMTFTNPLTDLVAGPQGMGLLDEFDAFRAANEQLAGSVGQVRDRLAEQIEYWGMDADAVELAKLAKQGATQQELDELRTLQGRLRELEAQKKSANAAAAGVKTSGTIEARSAYSPELPDAGRGRGDMPPYVDRYAGIGDAVPVAVDVQPVDASITTAVTQMPPENAPVIPPALETAWADILGSDAEPAQPKDRQIPWLEKIARGIEALVAKEGLVVEEVRS